jgi:secretion/DNA translocation related TadE-like protein
VRATSAASGSGRGDRGAASLLVVAMVGVLLLVGCALGVVAAVLVDHRRAAAAADLAALAGAAALQRGDDGCSVAATLAGANGARLLTCAVEGADVLVTVEVAGPRWLGQRADLVGRARAGPAVVPP